jgi:hypothetical protein
MTVSRPPGGPAPPTKQTLQNHRAGLPRQGQGPGQGPGALGLARWQLLLAGRRLQWGGRRLHAMAEVGGVAPDHLPGPGQADGLQGGAQLGQHWGKVGTEALLQSDGNWQYVHVTATPFSKAGFRM